MMLCTFAIAESTSSPKTIAPMNNAFNENEGTYAAAFKPADLKDGMLNLQLLTLDQYAPEAIEKIAVGDELVIENAQQQVTQDIVEVKNITTGKIYRTVPNFSELETEMILRGGKINAIKGE